MCTLNNKLREMGEHSKDMNVRPFYVMIDVVNNCIDLNAFLDYLKNTYKKEILILNAVDFAEKEVSRPSKGDPKPSNRSKHDPNETIIKGLKNKIDAELQKVNEAIKKQQAAESKSKDARHSRSKSRSKLSSGNLEASQQIFQSQIDILIIIVSYPYFKDQLHMMMKQHMTHCAFVAFIPENEELVTKEYEFHQIDKSSKGEKTKKVQIPGLELDFTFNPSCYPPARWQSLQLFAHDTIPFTEVKVGADFESTFKNLESEIVLITKARFDYQEAFRNKLKEIPLATNRVDIEDFKTYTNFNQGQYLNGIYYELSLHNFNVIEPLPPLSQGDVMAQVFKKNRNEVTRTVVYNQPTEPDDIFFDNKQSPFLTSLFTNVMKWKLKTEDALMASAVLPFLIKPIQFHCYAGQKFDNLITQMNKKYSLNLPPNYFDWQQWNLYTEQPAITEILEECLKTSLLIEMNYEKETGMCWVLAMEPISRNMGNAIRKDFMPNTMSGMTDYIKELYDKQPGNEKRMKQQTPAQILRSGGKPQQLLHPFHEILKGEPIYKMPIQLMHRSLFSSSYFFENGLRVRVEREISDTKCELTTTAFYKDIFRMRVGPDYISLNTIEGVRLIIESNGSISLIFYEESIYFNGTDVVTKSSNEKPLAIAGDGSLIMDQGKTKRIVMPNGTIATYNGNMWMYVDKNGEAYERKHGELVPLNLKHAVAFDADKKITKQIRPDNIEYYVDSKGLRRILLNLELGVEQTEEEVTFEIPNLPLIKYSKKEGFTIVIDRYTVVFNGSLSTFKCEDISLVFDGQAAKCEYPGGEMFLSNSRQEFKCENKVLVVTDNGIESMCELGVETKKKNFAIETKWGTSVPVKESLVEPQHSDLHKVFNPRFFVVYSDLTATEFYRPDSVLNEPNTVLKEEHTNHPSGDPVKVITMHSEEEIPQVFVELETPNKMQRTTIMKSLQIPKKLPTTKKKGEKEVTMDDLYAQAEGYIYEFAFNKKIFCESLQNILERQHQKYLMENSPEEEEEEIKPVQPVSTPPPRYVKAQQIAHEPRLGEKQMNFWESHESDFSFPKEVKYPPAKPISPRCGLNDPPRCHDGKPTDIPKI